MSASIDTKLYLRYFGAGEAMEVPGKLFPIERVFAEKPIDSAEERIQVGLHYAEEYMLRKLEGDSTFPE